MVGGAVAGRLFSNPTHEPRYVRMRGEQFKGVEFALQCFFSEERVDMIVARRTEPHNSSLHLGSVKLAFVALVGVPCPRD